MGGSGWLTLPKAFGIYGLGTGSILMVLAGVNAWICLKLLSKVLKKHKNVQNYAELIMITLGHRAKVALNIIFAINLIGTIIAYGLVANMLICSVLEQPMAA